MYKNYLDYFIFTTFEQIIYQITIVIIFGYLSSKKINFTQLAKFIQFIIIFIYFYSIVSLLIYFGIFILALLNWNTISNF